MAVTTPTQIRIPDDVKIPATAWAKDNDGDLSKLVVRLLREHLAKEALLPVFMPPPRPH